MRRMENIRKRYTESMAGKLFLVATPIGNLTDISERAIETLKHADIIAAEDTRNSIKLLNHFAIKAPLTSYHEYNKIDKAYELVGKMQDGSNVALVTDAGMPAISDPGEDIVRIAYEAGIEVTIIPGPCAAVSALAISGLKTRRFVFEGFLPTQKKEAADVLESLKRETRTIIMYEAPHRLVKTLKVLCDTLGEERKISLVREITKLHEEVIRTTLGDAVKKYESEEPKGEFVLVIEGLDTEALKQIEKEESDWYSLSIKEHVQMYMDRGMDSKEAMKTVAKDRGIGKREVYKECVDDADA